MTRLQWFSIGIAAILVLAFYFFGETKPKEQRNLEKSRALNMEQTNVEVLRKEAMESLPVAASAELELLEHDLKPSGQDSSQIGLLEELSSKWYQAGHPAISGYYAQRIAESRKSAESWSIAGSTYFIGLRGAKVDKIKAFCFDRAVQAFESAISLEPSNPSHQVNLALTYVENPPENNPMQGVQLLLQLNEKYPDNLGVLNNLARLAIQTGQYDRAIQRLERALEIDPDFPRTICLMAEASRGAGLVEKAAQFAQRCKSAQQEL